MAYFIDEELTKPTNPDEVAPVTDLIDYLVRSLAQEAYGGIRGAQTYYRIVSRARDIRDYIDELIVEAEAYEDWATYFEYTAQIEPLEKLLLLISFVIPEETDAANKPLRPVTILDCLNNITNWQHNRNTCRGVSKALHNHLGDLNYSTETTPFKIPDDYDWKEDLKAAANHDDLSWVGIVVDSMSEGLTTFAGLTKTMTRDPSKIKAVIEGLAKIQTALEENPANDETMVFSTRCFMVMHGVITVAVEVNTKIRTIPEDEKLVKHLLTPRTWDWALKMINALQDVVRVNSRPSEGLLKDWSKYEEYLLNPKEQPLDAKCLIPYQSKVRPPYQARSLALVELCSNMARSLENLGESVEIRHIEKYNLAINMAINAMESIAAATERITRFDWDDVLAHPASQEINKAKADIVAAYRELRMIDNVEDKMSKALQRDQQSVKYLDKHITSLEDRGKPVDARDLSEELRIRIRISDDYTSSPTTTINHRMKPSGDLDAVLWNFCSRFSDPSNSLADRPRVYVEDGTNPRLIPIRPGQLMMEELVHLVRNTKDKPFTSPITVAVGKTITSPS